MDEKQEYINSQFEKRFDKIEARMDKLENKMDGIELSQKEQTIILTQIKSDLDSRKARNEKNLNDIFMKLAFVLIGGLGTLIGTALFK